MAHGVMRTKSLGRLIAETQQEGQRLKKVLTAWDLVAIGIGCMVGVGIFILPGVEAAKHAGPAIIISFVLAAATCGCAALCYAELAAMIPVSGSAYTYGYATLGEILAWIIGWDLVLEYMVGASLVAIGWSSYFVNLLHGTRFQLPHNFVTAPFGPNPGYLDLPAILIVLAICYLLVRGIKESSRVNLTVVIIKVSAILLFIFVACWYIKPHNWVPFTPFGWKGVMTAAAIVFIAYIGFDAVSTTAEEARNPQRDLPIGIMVSLAIATFLYMAVAAIMTGVVHYSDLGVADPIAKVLNVLHMRWTSALVSVGALAGITSVLIVLLMAQPRILFSMSRDGLLPGALSKVHKRFKTPYITTWVTGCIVATAAALTPINIVAELCSIGTLFAFIIVCAGVIVLRYTRPELKRPFKVPFAPYLPALGIILCTSLMFSLPWVTWLRFIIWMAIGLVIYFTYGYRNSGLNGMAAQKAPGGDA